MRHHRAACPCCHDLHAETYSEDGLFFPHVEPFAVFRIVGGGSGAGRENDSVVSLGDSRIEAIISDDRYLSATCNDRVSEIMGKRVEVVDQQERGMHQPV